MRVLTAEQMREADRRTIEEVGLPAIVLMENAGHQVVFAMYATMGDLTTRRIGVLCGRGNNGGDGLVVARVLWQQGIDVRVFFFGSVSDLTGDAGRNLLVAQRLGVSVVEIVDRDAWDGTQPAIGECNLLVDAIFGTGLSKPLDDFLTAVVGDVNALNVPVVAIDLPSGLSADEVNPIGEAIEADVTVALAAPKPALLVPPAEAWAGDLVIANIGIPGSVIDDVPGDRLELLTPEEVSLLMPPRPIDSHKGDFGHVLVVAGSLGRTGAAHLAGLGALRSGAGLVTVATPRSCVPLVAASAPEYMTLPLAETADGTLASDALAALLSFQCDAVAIGPGLGLGSDVAAVVYGLIDRSEVPLVIDADALNVLSDDMQHLKGRPGVPIVITPHPGEMARLCQTTSVAVQSNRLALTRHLAMDHQVYVILKGAGTLIGEPDGTIRLNLTGNPGMATGGIGDVLTGVTAAWLAQTGNASAACQIAVFLHGRAGDLAADTHGEVALTASDLIAALGQAVRETAEPDDDDEDEF